MSASNAMPPGHAWSVSAGSGREGGHQGRPGSQPSANQRGANPPAEIQSAAAMPEKGWSRSTNESPASKELAPSLLIAGACSAPHCSTVDGTLPASANSSPSLQYLQPPAEASTGMLSRATAMATTASSPNTTTGQPARASPRRPPSS